MRHTCVYYIGCTRQLLSNLFLKKELHSEHTKIRVIVQLYIYIHSEMTSIILNASVLMKQGK